MQYAIINANGALEVRKSSINEVPPGGVEVTDEQKSILLSDPPSLVLVNGKLEQV